MTKPVSRLSRALMARERSLRDSRRRRRGVTMPIRAMRARRMASHVPMSLESPTASTILPDLFH